METGLIVLLTIFIPVIGSFTIPVAGWISKSARSAWSLILGGATAVLPLFLIPLALSGGQEVFRKPLILGLDFILIADPLSIFMSIVSSFVGFLIILYSLGYIAHEENQNEYYLMVVLFIGSMMGLVYSANLIFMYLFWEIIAICCWRLIGFYRLKDFILKADKAFLVTFFGAVVMLLGFVQIYGNTKTFDLTAMRGTMIPGTAVLLILFGVYNKLPLKGFIEPILEGHVEAGEHLDFTTHALALFNPVAMISVGCLIIALLLHLYGWKKGDRKAYLASEPVHKFPVIKQIYDLAEARIFYIYEQGMKFLR